MVTISRQYPFGTDKAVPLSRAVCFDEGAQAEYSTRKRQNHLIDQEIR